MIPLSNFMGFKRTNGKVGVRNHVVIMPTTACANGVVSAIGREVPGVVPLLHGHGCGRGGSDLEIHFRTLINLASHPNVAAVLLIGLGCEVIKSEYLIDAIKATGKPVEQLNIQAEGGSVRTKTKAVSIANDMLSAALLQERELIPISELIVGLECGGSDAFSGVTANGAVGVASDWVVEKGGTVILTENTEMIGTSHILKARSINDNVAAAVADLVARAEKRSVDVLGPLAAIAIAPGNMDGGMSSIREKSLGCIVKGGTTAIRQVVSYGEIPSEKGLVLMDAPGYDTESMTGVVAGGAQIMLFTTGRGNPIGFPIVPVIKIASTSRLYEHMNDDMDINAGKILEGATLQEVGSEVINAVREVANGQLVKAENNQQAGIVCIYTGQSSL
ncbi:MAG: UxaA family hydrolase [Methylocystaceae bacterium]